LGFHGSKTLKKEVVSVKKMRNVEWQNYRHPEFLQSLSISVNELKYVKLFLKGGAASLVNEILRERKSKQSNYHRNNNLRNYNKREKIEA
jgi:hypothetical protein